MIATLATRSRVDAARAARTQTEPLLVQAVTLYNSLSDANATATATFLTGGLEPPKRRAHYLQDLRLATGSLTTLTREVNGSGEARAAVRSISDALPVYTGLVDSARANNLQGFPVGAAYLRQASALLTGTILPAANQLYAIEAQRLGDDYRSGTSNAPLVALAIAIALSLLILLAAQIYVARVSRRVLNVWLLLATLVVGAVSVWAVVGLLGERNALIRAQRNGSDSVEVLTASRVLLSRAQSDQSLTLVGRGTDETSPADFQKVINVLSPQGGMIGEFADARRPHGRGRGRRTPGKRVCVLSIRDCAGHQAGTGRPHRRCHRFGSGSSCEPVVCGNATQCRPRRPGRGSTGPLPGSVGGRHVRRVGPVVRDPGTRRARRDPGVGRTSTEGEGIPMRRRIAQLLIASGAAAALAGCGSTSDRPLRITLAALNAQAPAPSPSPPTPPTHPCGNLTASLRPPAVMPAPGAMPPGSFMAKIQRRGYLLAGVNTGFLGFGYLNPFTGRIEGFEIDLARELARAIFGDPGHLQLRALTVPQRIPSVQQGSVDIVVDAVTITCAASPTGRLLDRLLRRRAARARPDQLARLGVSRTSAASGYARSAQSTPIQVIEHHASHPIAVGAPQQRSTVSSPCSRGA